MNVNWKILWSLLIVVCIFISTYLIRPYSNFLLMFFPPNDLYKPLILEPITLKEKKLLFELPLRHEYVGSYLVGVFMEQTPGFDTQIQSNASLTLEIMVDNTTLLNQKYDNWEGVFWGAPENSGVILGSYKVPDQIPLKQETTAILTITSSDPNFDKKYGNLKFFIKRFLNK